MLADDFDFAVEQGGRTFARDGVGKRLGKRLVGVIQVDDLGNGFFLVRAAGVETTGLGELGRVLSANQPFGGVGLLNQQAGDLRALADEEELDANIATS